MIVAEELGFAYGERPILEGLDLRVGRGEIVGIVGPNGAGKTTLLRLLSGVLRPTAGKVVVDGRDLASTGAAERARLISVSILLTASGSRNLFSSFRVSLKRMSIFFFVQLSLTEIFSCSLSKMRRNSARVCSERSSFTARRALSQSAAAI